MLSYQHGYHAGNHADVLKHLVLVHVLDHLNRKPKPWRYVDTHAGAGLYALGDERALKRQEFRSGIDRLWGRPDLPDSVARLCALVGESGANGARAESLTHYPGSPVFAQRIARETDELRLFELHPGEGEALSACVADDRRTRVLREDGFRGALGQLPPPSRRGLVLVDPPYEVKSDYQAVVRFLAAAHRRFATGTVAVWYPVVERARIDQLHDALRTSGIPDLVYTEASVKADTESHGMTGSGLVVLHPPWTLGDMLEETLPWLCGVLAQEEGAHWRFQRLSAES